MEKEARYYKKLENKKVQCLLCPHTCLIKENKLGNCNARKNKKGKLISLSYGKPVAVNIDPIEKKPFFHFYPGEKAYSLGTFGCNFHCKGCQNWDISQRSGEDASIKKVPPKDIIKRAKDNNCKIIAYTYNEPTVFYEYMLETAKLAKKQGLKNVIITNGYTNPKPLKELCNFIDGATVDLKFIEDKPYKEYCGAKLKPVLESLKIYYNKNVHLEITNLMIETLNTKEEQIEKMAKWIKENLDENIPLHLSRFFPYWKAEGKIEPTKTETMKKAKKICDKYLNFVYLGNIMYENITRCPNCGKELIKRAMAYIENNLKGNKCDCGFPVYGRFVGL
ncbi:AmmeMemoRadiSam system radical SAM enzyme [Candidatus Woesearchaeota archaeon]|nr:AmmeMemoRadiSam system radical SAM enzyme [Candidatus Woesearchaeota archaeon]